MHGTDISGYAHSPVTVFSKVEASSGCPQPSTWSPSTTATPMMNPSETVQGNCEGWTGLGLKASLPVTLLQLPEGKVLRKKVA